MAIKSANIEPNNDFNPLANLLKSASISDSTNPILDASIQETEQEHDITAVMGSE